MLLRSVPVLMAVWLVCAALLTAQSAATAVPVPVPVSVSVSVILADELEAEASRPQPTTSRLLQARVADDTCPTSYYSCANQGAQFDNICCPYGEVCSLGADGRPACCPAAAVCTGNAPDTDVTTTASASTGFSAGSGGPPRLQLHLGAVLAVVTALGALFSGALCILL